MVAPQKHPRLRQGDGALEPLYQPFSTEGCSVGWGRVAPLSDICEVLIAESFLASVGCVYSSPKMTWTECHIFVLTPSLAIYWWANLWISLDSHLPHWCLSWRYHLSFATFLGLIPGLEYWHVGHMSSLLTWHETHTGRHVTGHHFFWASHPILGASSTAWSPLCPHFLLPVP